MDITVYLPDEIGEAAKKAELNLSRLLRGAVTDELERRAAVDSTLSEVSEFFIDIEDDEGRVHSGRLTGRLIAYDERTSASVFLADDERVILHIPEKLTYWTIEDPEEELRDQLDDGPYIDAMRALGIKPVVDL